MKYKVGDILIDRDGAIITIESAINDPRNNKGFYSGTFQSKSKWSDTEENLDKYGFDYIQDPNSLFKKMLKQ